MKKLIIASMVLLLGGCAHEVPQGVAFKKPEQLKLNSASHWEILANNEADLIMKTLKKSSTLPLYIKEPSGSYPFAKTYKHLLTSNIVARGGYVVTDPEFNAATISYTVDIVKHSANFKENMKLATPLAQGVYYGAATVLGRGVHDVTTTAIEVVKAPFYAAVDQVKPNLATPVEVVITTQIVLGNQILNSDSRVYYIEKGNLQQYYYPEPSAVPHQFKVSDLQ